MAIIQYDIFGNVVPQKLCKCGCGGIIYGDNDYIHGHWMKDSENAKLQGEKISQWCKDNPEKVKLRNEKTLQWCKDHPEEVKLRSEKYSQWCKDHPEEIKLRGENHSQWFKDHPKEIKLRSEKFSQWFKDHPEEVKLRSEKYSQWCKDHPEEIKLQNEHHSATLQGIPYDEWEAFARNSPYCPLFNEKCKESNREKYNKQCFLCDLLEKENKYKNGKQIKLSVHHIDMDKMQGCDGRRWKLIPVCIHCHGKLHNELWEYRIMWLLKNVWNK